jgi:hypothetical protein
VYEEDMKPEGECEQRNKDRLRKNRKQRSCMKETSDESAETEIYEELTEIPCERRMK